MAAALSPPAYFSPGCRCRASLGKASQRLLTALDAQGRDPAVGERLVRRFLATSSKSAAIGTFSHALSSPVRRPHVVLPVSSVSSSLGL